MKSADHKALGLSTLCDAKCHSLECLDRTCNQRETHTVEEMLRGWARDNPSDVVCWLTWKHVETTVGQKVVKRLTNVACSGTRSDLQAVIVEKLTIYG